MSSEHKRAPLALRTVLLLDAAATSATGLLLAVGAGPLAPVLGLPAGLLRGAGVVLLPFAAALAWLATRPGVMRRAVWTIVVANLLWVVDSALLLLGGWFDPTQLGHAFVSAQALVVALFAGLQWAALRDQTWANARA
ncbi:MAG TPA: hypothetical protein VFY16_03580 [Gemmatimonadaceae bacterium]|nr:hypothetical protein [Gemmatimonadaceae bacterium]